ncbi:conserved hypothetical protein [Ricinus communis]|uniref:Uncharacterized protein n=1 Tax=Ricinus communis TaxID=3988 RepID=B9T709_RICCO|nr:conserved hypothetical protein [Ricinus communis]
MGGRSSMNLPHRNIVRPLPAVSSPQTRCMLDAADALCALDAADAACARRC